MFDSDSTSKLVCEHCEDPFLPKMKTQKFCSRPCSVDAHNVLACARGKVARELANPARLVECKICSTIFETRSGNKQTCSDECSRENSRRGNRMRLTGNQAIIFARDGNRCAYCGSTPLEDGAKLTLDHIVPYSQGGDHTADNLVTACDSCNASKSDQQAGPHIQKAVNRLNEQNGIDPSKMIRVKDRRDYK